MMDLPAKYTEYVEEERNRAKLRLLEEIAQAVGAPASERYGLYVMMRKLKAYLETK